MKSSRGGGRNVGKHQSATRNSGGSVSGMSFSGNPSNSTNSSNGYTTANSASAQANALSSAIATSKAKYPSYFANTGNWSNTGASASSTLTSKAQVDAQVAKAQALSVSFNSAKNQYKAYFSNPSNSTQNISSASMLNTSISKAQALNNAIAKSKKDNPEYFKNTGQWSAGNIGSQTQLDKRNLTARQEKDFVNAEQTAYVNAIRSGKVNIATALLKQRTPGGYKGPNTVNIKKFLTERGYDITKPETIPNSIFKPEKQLQARTQTKNQIMGDLNLKANKYKKIDAKPQEFFSLNLSASEPLEYFGPTNKNRIENFKLIDNQPLSLTGFVDTQYGKNTITGETQRLKTVGETTSPEMQFFGQFVQGSRNTFDSYGNLLTNLGNTVTGKPQQPMSRPPVQDQFFGALIDSGKNTFYGKQDRSADPMGDFLGIQKKRIDTMGYGQVAGELATEALFWALPVGAIGKVAKGGLGFFSKTVKTTKASKAFTPGADFMKMEGKTKNVSVGDQLGAFFGPKGKAKVKTVPFLSSSVSLGRGTVKGKGKKGGNDFFGGSSGGGKKSNFFDDSTKSIKTNNGLVLLTKQKSITKLLPKPKGFGKQDFLKLSKKYDQKIIAKELAKQKAILKQSQKQMLKQKQKLKTKQVTKQQFFKPILLVTPKVKQKQTQVLKQNQKQQQFFKQPTKVIAKTTPKVKQKYPMTGVIAPYFPPTPKTTGMFLPPLPLWARPGGVRGSRGGGKRLARKSFTAWNVNPNQVGGFLKGPTYKKSRSDYIFKDLDKRTKKEKPKKDYDYLDFF